jgi:hypothetical protein
MPSRVSSPGRRGAAVAVAAALALPVIASAGNRPEARETRDAADVDAGGAARDAGAACVAVRAEARYVPYGWSHVVVLASTCPKGASCTVSTDVNPDKQTVTVAKGATVEVITFLSSPSQTFTPLVACTLR